MKITTCKSCGAPIIWARSGAGRMMPVDAATTPGGNVIVKDIDFGHTTAYVLTKEQAAAYQGGDAHLSHFATCPDAAKHRHTRSTE